MGFDFEIQFKPGCANRVAGVLSRKTVGEVELGALITTHGLDWTTLEKEILQDPLLNQIRQDIVSGAKTHVHIALVHDKLLFKGRYVIPRSSTFVPILLREYHDSPTGGHWGFEDLNTVGSGVVLEGNT